MPMKAIGPSLIVIQMTWLAEEVEVVKVLTGFWSAPKPTASIAFTKCPNPDGGFALGT